MDATSNIATDLFYKIRSRFTNLKLGENSGEITINPEDARFFDFDYTENDKVIGHISISLAESNSMKVYFSSGITEGMDDTQKDGWYKFLREMRLFAKRRLMSFDTRDVAKDMLDQRDYAFLSQHSTPKPVSNDTITKPVGEGMMNESNMYGTRKQSYQTLLDTKLIIKHSKTLEDDSVPGARTRNIGALFVENQEGERFKYPFIHLAGARAMQRHVANGGLPYDDVGKSIIGMSEDIARLKNFGSYVVRNDLMNSDNNSVVERSVMQLEQLKDTIKKMSKQGHYEAYVENFTVSDAVEVPDEVLEQYTEQFTVKNFKEDIKDVFPILYRLTQEQRSEDIVGYDDIVEMTEAGDEDMESKILDWVKKYETNIGNNGDTLPEGYLQYMMSSGIFSDAYDQDETAKAEKMLGKSYTEWDYDDQAKALEMMPITKAMFDEIEQITGTSGEDAAEIVDGVLNKQDESQEEDLGIFSKFENWAMGLGEDSPIQLADENEKAELINKLNKLVGEHFPAGIDGKNAIQSLQGIIEDPKLDADIKNASKEDPDGCVRGLVKAWIEENDPETLDKLDFGDYVDEPAVGADKVEPQQEEDVTNEGGNKFKVQEVAELISSFYDKDLGTFPKGPEGVCTMVGKKFGEQAEQVARKFVERMAPQQVEAGEYVEAQAEEENTEVARIRKLSGL